MLTVKIRANTAQTKLKEIMADGCVKIDVAAVRQNGEANAELIRFLAEEFAVTGDAIEILTGHTANVKRIRIKK